MASGSWIKYSNGDNVSIVVNLDRALRFRHLESGSESYVEILIEGETHSVLLSTDPGAYQDVLDYIKRTTGYELS
jgi:hypothetical protein